MARYFTSDAAVERIALGVLDLTLPRADWTHAAHFAATFWLIRHRPELPLDERLPEIIRAYNEATGTPNTNTSGYHETITQASLAAARRFVADQPASRPLYEIVDQLMGSVLGDPNWLLAYWSRELLFSSEARRLWTQPDLRPFEPAGWSLEVDLKRRPA
jgi:hypothetical protein